MKKLFAIMMSAIMTMTFMPAMVWAEETPTEPVAPIEQTVYCDTTNFGTVYYHDSTSSKAVLGIFNENADPEDGTPYNVGTRTVKIISGSKYLVKSGDPVKKADRTNYTFKGKAAGTAKVKVTFAGDAAKNIAATSMTYTIKVKKATKLSSSNVSLSKTSYTYNAKEQRPSVSVKVCDKTVSSKYYTVTKPSASTNAGTYEIKVKGKTKYYGTITKSYKIKKRTQTIEAEIDKTELTTYKDEKATVKFTKSSIGAEKATFTVSDTNMATVTTAKDGKSATIKAKGTKSGTVTVTVKVAGGKNNTDATKKFDIKVVGPADLSKAKINLATTSFTYSGKENKPALSVTLNGKTVPSKAYTIVYSSNVNAGTAKATIKANDKAYKGSKSATYTIKKAAQKLTLSTNLVKLDPNYNKNYFISKQRMVKSVYTLSVKTNAKGVSLSQIKFETEDEDKALRTGGKKDKLKVLDKNPTIVVENGAAKYKFEIKEYNTFKKKVEGHLLVKISSPATANYKATTKTADFTVELSK